MDFHLPTEMEPFREQILASRHAYIKAKAGPKQETGPWVSKVGGLPYYPIGAQWPVSKEGKPLFFLAQLNFSEMPELPGFPKTGLVQFFILDDDLYGMNFDDGEQQDAFRVLYYPIVSEQDPQQKSPGLPEEFEFLPHHPDESYPLLFSYEIEVVPITDYQFWNYFPQDFFQQFGDRSWDIMEEYGKSVRAQGHKIGGFSFFTQDDPRRHDDPMVLLFQLDSDEGMDLMWGDMGVGHFFIRPSDLEALNFSRVLYDWDCF